MAAASPFHRRTVTNSTRAQMANRRSTDSTTVNNRTTINKSRSPPRQGIKMLISKPASSTAARSELNLLKPLNDLCKSHPTFSILKTTYCSTFFPLVRRVIEQRHNLSQTCWVIVEFSTVQDARIAIRFARGVDIQTYRGYGGRGRNMQRGGRVEESRERRLNSEPLTSDSVDNCTDLLGSFGSGITASSSTSNPSFSTPSTSSSTQTPTVVSPNPFMSFSVSTRTTNRKAADDADVDSDDSGYDSGIKRQRQFQQQALTQTQAQTQTYSPAQAQVNDTDPTDVAMASTQEDPALDQFADIFGGMRMGEQKDDVEMGG